MYDAMRLIEKLPEMLSGQELLQKMQILPEYDREICTGGTPTQRLMRLQDAYTQRMGMLHSYINLSVTQNVQNGKRKKKCMDLADTEVRSQVSVPAMSNDCECSHTL